MSSSTPTFGSRLRQARQARGVSLHQIAAVSKISIGALEALERDDISRLPGGIFSRGFVRSYADAVGLDPEETVRQFLESFPDDDVTAGSPLVLHLHEEQEETRVENRRRMTSTLAKLILVSVPIGILLLYLSTRGGPASPTASSPAGEAAVLEPASGPSTSAARTGTVEPPGVIAPHAPPARPEPTLAPPEGDSARAAPVATPGSDPVLLEIAPSRVCWVSLTVDGSLVIAREMQPGERIVRRIETEAVIEIGDAAAFTFTLNGRPGLPLGEAGQVRTVRITPENFVTLLR